MAKNPTRLFVVRACGVDVRAVGTAFNVKLTGPQLEVLVSEGTVHISQQTPPAPAASAPSGVLVPAAPVLLAALTAGQRTVIPVAPLIAPPGVVLASTREIAQLLDWRPHLFDFESTPLAEGVETFNRRNSLHLVIGDDDLRALPIVASFRSDTAEGFVRLIEGTMGVAPPAGLPRLAVSRLHRKAGANLFGPRLNHPSDPIPQTRGPLMAERTSRIVPSQKAPYFAQRDVQRFTQRSPRHNH